MSPNYSSSEYVPCNQRKFRCTLPDPAPVVCDTHILTSKIKKNTPLRVLHKVFPDLSRKIAVRLCHKDDEKALRKKTKAKYLATVAPTVSCLKKSIKFNSLPNDPSVSLDPTLTSDFIKVRSHSMPKLIGLESIGLNMNNGNQLDENQDIYTDENNMRMKIGLSQKRTRASVADIYYKSPESPELTIRRKKKVRFSPTLLKVVPTHSAGEYNRESVERVDLDNWRALENVVKEMTLYKLNEMEVAPESAHNTSYFGRENTGRRIDQEVQPLTTHEPQAQNVASNIHRSKVVPARPNSRIEVDNLCQSVRGRMAIPIAEDAEEHDISPMQGSIPEVAMIMWDNNSDSEVDWEDEYCVYIKVRKELQKRIEVIKKPFIKNGSIYSLPA